MTEKAITHLSQLIAVPSHSRDEAAAADVVERFLRAEGVGEVNRLGNNVWALAGPYDPAKHTLMLNAHLDTVPPAASYTRHPYTPQLEGDRLYGLGANDDGASAVSLAMSFLAFCGKQLPINLLLALTAEEECMGEGGMRGFLPHLAEQGITVDAAIVGEPTGMQPAIGERGLVVMDCVARGVAGHAARGEGVNALYKAIADIERLRNFKFERVSPLLGPITLNVTQINAGTRHNVIPDECRFVVDIRTTDAYTNEEVAAIIKDLVDCEARERSTRVRASALPHDHPLLKAVLEVMPSAEPMVSLTSSDMALMPFPTIKIGPGESARSHAADEFIRIPEIEEALTRYPQIISAYMLGFESNDK